ncbi:MAG: dihydrodipicolinate synthase family protein [Clostridiales bacterium]|nr:dihydrodipicolinate synthase family protein [Clostridiales bacterium]
MLFMPKGIIIPVVTPITQDGKFNEPVYRELLEHFVTNGVHGVFPFGTTGEFYAFDNAFYRNVLEVTKDAVGGRMDIYAGANHITTRGAIEIAQIAQEVGVEALSVLTPMFVSQTQAEVEQYYREIADSTDLPIIIYNNKPKTNVTVEPATVARLAKIKNIVAAKDSTGDMTNTEEYIRLTRDNPEFKVLMGRDTLIYAALCYGAVGAITSCGNVAPRLAVDIYEHFMAGNAQEALEAQFKLSMLRIATNMGTFPVVLKEALEMIGFPVGKCVAPIQPLNEAQREKLSEVLTTLGLVDAGR